MDVSVALVILVALVGVFGFLAYARQSGVIPNQKKIDQADGSTSVHVDSNDGNGGGGNGGGD